MAPARSLVIVGAGGLGVPAAWGIVSDLRTVGHLSIGIIDPEILELSNLNRQILYATDEIGKSKAELLASKLVAIAKSRRADLQNLQISPISRALDSENISTLFSNVDYVIDATDSPATKFLINDYCVSRNIPFCYGGVIGSFGQILSVVPKRNSSSACLRCLFGNFDKEDFCGTLETCQSMGILGTVAGYIGFLQARAAITHLCRNSYETDSTGNPSVLKRFSLADLREKSSFVLRDPNCPICNYS